MHFKCIFLSELNLRHLDIFRSKGSSTEFNTYKNKLTCVKSDNLPYA